MRSVADASDEPACSPWISILFTQSKTMFNLYNLTCMCVCVCVCVCVCKIMYSFQDQGLEYMYSFTYIVYRQSCCIILFRIVSTQDASVRHNGTHSH